LWYGWTREMSAVHLFLLAYQRKPNGLFCLLRPSGICYEMDIVIIWKLQFSVP
jgi:hypothetical protein